MKRFKIKYILGRDIRIVYAEDQNSNDVLIEFLTKHPSVTDVLEIKEVAE